MTCRARFRGAHAPRVLAAAPRRDQLPRGGAFPSNRAAEKVRKGEAPSQHAGRVRSPDSNGTLSSFDLRHSFGFRHLDFVIFPQQPREHLFPGRHPAAAFVGAKPLKDFALEIKPAGVRIMRLHDFFPARHRHSVGGFLVPGNLLHLQPPIRAGVENRPAEKKQERHLAFFDPVKIFGRGEIEIGTSRHRQDRFGRTAKGAGICVCVRPEFVPQSLTPLLRRPKSSKSFSFSLGE